MHEYIDGSNRCFFTGCLPDHVMSPTARESTMKRHIDRSIAQRTLLIRETPEMYSKSHEPFINSIPESAIGWVFKILNKEKEVCTVFYNVTLISMRCMLTTHVVPPQFLCVLKIG